MTAWTPVGTAAAPADQERDGSDPAGELPTSPATARRGTTRTAPTALARSDQPAHLDPSGSGRYAGRHQERPTADLRVTGEPVERVEEALTAEALIGVGKPQRRFGSRVNELLALRTEHRDEVARTGTLNLLPETERVRRSDWTVAPALADLTDRRVETNGPTEMKMAVNALNAAYEVVD